MKKVLTIVLIYILTCVFGTAALGLLFMFNLDMLKYVTDAPATFFSLDAFLYGLSVSFPLVGIAVLVAIVLLMIRDKTHQIPGLITYAVLGLLTWLVFIPFSLTQLSSYETDNIELRVERTSPGVFREDSRGVFYYSRILESGNADGIFIDTNDFTGKAGNVITFYDAPVSNASAFPYSDILIKKSLQPPKFVTYPISFYSVLLIAAEHMNSTGFLGWLSFATLGLALLSVYGVQFYSSWKLSSALSVLITVIAIIAVNYFYYMDMIPQALKQFGKMLSEFTDADNPLIVVINVIMSGILILYGVAMAVYRFRKVEVSVTGEEA